MTVCSPLLHPLLLKEHAAYASDLAVNFEASALLPSGSRMFGPPPGAVEDVLPHNFALLTRKGPGLDAVLQMVRPPGEGASGQRPEQCASALGV